MNTDKPTKVVASIGIMHDRDGLSIEELRHFVEQTKGLVGELKRNSECSDHEYVTFDFVVEDK